jgi:outer membrane protein OmpA-like peptidoglycan-associated protein
VTEKKIEITETVQFETGSAVIREESKPILKEVAQVMQDHPEITMVKVEGHTDNRGDKGYNLKLSKDRAKSVKAFLISEGVDGKRLDSEGFGDKQPIADNNTEEGRLKNRRVEFSIVSKK